MERGGGWLHPWTDCRFRSTFQGFAVKKWMKLVFRGAPKHIRRQLHRMAKHPNGRLVFQ